MCHSLMGGKLESDWCARFCWRSTSDQTTWPVFPMVLGRIRQLLTSVCHITAACQQLRSTSVFLFFFFLATLRSDSGSSLLCCPSSRPPPSTQPATNICPDAPGPVERPRSRCFSFEQLLFAGVPARITAPALNRWKEMPAELRLLS